MSLAKFTANGQVTIPTEIRRILGLRSGDKIMFVERNGEVVINNASAQAIMKAQRAFQGVAKQMGLNDDEDVSTMVKEIRHER